MPDKEDEEVANMTAQEVAKKLGFTPSMVHKLVNQNKIPYTVIGDPAGARMRRVIRFKPSDVQKFIDDRKAQRTDKNA
jgi:predicted DNA-binding transcriptional regulator AlpA